MTASAAVASGAQGRQELVGYPPLDPEGRCGDWHLGHHPARVADTFGQLLVAPISIGYYDAAEFN